MSVMVKICGLTRAEDAALAVELGADLIGLNFYPKSPRCLSLERALEIRGAVAGRAWLVGLFVNAARGKIDEIRCALALDLLQFHGDEDESELRGWPVPVIRACRLGPGAALEVLKTTAADYVLLDSYDPMLFGGTGRALPFELLEGADLGRVFIAGGLTPATVRQAAALNPYGVDVASGVESAPGVKDPAKLRSFIQNAKSAR